MGNSNLPSFDPTPDDLIDNLCYEIVHRLFGIERMWLSNKSWLTDFEPPPEIEGHEFLPLAEVPLDDQSLYANELPEFISSSQHWVWYPPVPEETRAAINAATRQRLLDQLTCAYGVSFDDWPAEEPLYIWKIAARIARKTTFRID